MKRTLSPQPLLDETLLLNFLKENNIKPVHIKPIWKHFVRNGTSWDSMTDDECPSRVRVSSLCNVATQLRAVLLEPRATECRCMCE